MKHGAAFGRNQMSTIAQDIRPGRTIERDIYPTRTNVRVHLPSGTPRKGHGYAERSSSLSFEKLC